MIPYTISFFTTQPYTEQCKYLTSKLEVKKAIFDLLNANGYSYHPFYRPSISILENDLRCVKYSDLVSLLRNIYSYCENFDDECLTPDKGVLVDSFGVSDCDHSYFVKVSYFNNDVLNSSFDEIKPLNALSKVVESYFDSCAGIGESGCILISSL